MNWVFYTGDETVCCLMGSGQPAVVYEFMNNMCFEYAMYDMAGMTCVYDGKDMCPAAGGEPDCCTAGLAAESPLRDACPDM